MGEYLVEQSMTASVFHHANYRKCKGEHFHEINLHNIQQNAERKERGVAGTKR